MTSDAYIAAPNVQRITYRPEGAKRSRVAYVRNPRESRMLNGTVLVGMEVDKGGTTKNVLQIIDTGLIRKRQAVRMSKMYAVYEVVPQ